MEAAGGEVFATMGDGVAAAFSSAEAAVHAAVSAQRALPVAGVAVRMGIHTGEVERVGDDYRGRPVNRAARIAGVAHGGQILLSNLSAGLLGSSPHPVALADLGAHRLRDLAEPERVWQVLHRDLRRQFPPVRGLDTYSNNLPAQRSSLVGRDREIEGVSALVGRHRIVTLTGVGGVGKTRLAIHTAVELLSGFTNVWFVELAKLSDSDDVAGAIALAAGAAAITDPLSTAAALLGGQRTLLVVDNCEHVVDGAAAVVDALTARCPNLSVIATSREPLGIDGEYVVGVLSLDPATTAVELFQQRTAAAGGHLGSVNRSSIEDLCRRLDGIPLAIELAASRTATLGLTAVLGALDDRWALVSQAGRRADGRHSTMWATIEWSYRLLSRDEQRMLQWLAAFPDGFELDAALHVAASMGIDGRHGDGARRLLGAQEHGVLGRPRVRHALSDAGDGAHLRLGAARRARRSCIRASRRSPVGWRRSPICPTTIRATHSSSATRSAWSERPTTGAKR